MQNSEGQGDIRIQRTRQLLQQALFDLTLEKGFASVTVRDIAERAKVNRSTFYRHYLDKYDLLAQYFDTLQHHITEAAATAEQSPSVEAVPAGLLLLVKHVQSHADFYRVMLGPHGDPAFIHRFRQLAEQRYQTLFARTPPDDSALPPIPMKLSYISYAAVGAILWWLEHGQATKPEDFTRWLGQLNMTAAGLPPNPINRD